MSIRRGTRRSVRKARAAAVAPTPPPPPSWTEVWESDDAVWSGGKLVSLTGQILGLQMLPTDVGFEPTQDGTALNGYTPLQFGTGKKRARIAGPIPGGPFTDFVIEIVRWMDNQDGVGDRQYDLYAANNTGSSSAHYASPEQANIVPFSQRGQAVNGTWFYNGASPTSRPEVATWRFSGGTTSDCFSNGVLVGSTVVGGPFSQDFADIFIGASYGSIALANLQHAKGPRYSWRIKVGSTFTDGQILTFATERMAKFGASNFNAYKPSDNPSTLKGWADSRGKHDVVPSQEWLGGSNPCPQWDGNAGSDIYLQGTSGKEPFEGSRINGRPSMAMHANEFFGSGAVSAFVGSSPDYDFSWTYVVKVLGITATQATPVDQRDCIVGDSGDYILLGLFSDSGAPSASLYYYSGGTKTVVVTGFSIGDTIRLRAMYKSATQELSLQLDDNAPVVFGSAVGPLGSVVGTMLWGKTPFSAAANIDYPEHVMRSAVDATINTNDMNYLKAEYDL